jgi:hypothetical protein
LNIQIFSGSRSAEKNENIYFISSGESTAQLKEVALAGKKYRSSKN